MRLRRLDPRSETDGDQDGADGHGGQAERDDNGSADGSTDRLAESDDETDPPADQSPPTDSEAPDPQVDGQADADVAANDLLELLSNRRRRYLWRALRREGSDLDLSEASRRIAAWENDVDVEGVEYDQRKSVYNSLHQFHCPKMADAGLVEFDKRGSTVRLASELPSQLTVTVEPETEDVRNTAFGALALAAGVVLGAWALELPVFGALSLAAVGLSLGIGASAALLVYTLFIQTEYGLSLADALSRVDG